MKKSIVDILWFMVCLAVCVIVLRIIGYGFLFFVGLVFLVTALIVLWDLFIAPIPAEWRAFRASLRRKAPRRDPRWIPKRRSAYAHWKGSQR